MFDASAPGFLTKNINPGRGLSNPNCLPLSNSPFQRT